MKVNMTVIFTLELDRDDVPNPETLFVEFAGGMQFYAMNDSGKVLVADEGDSMGYETTHIEVLAEELRPSDIPKTHPVRPLKAGQNAKNRASCEECGLSWDDAIITSMTPAPSARCPFEEFHKWKR